MALTYYAGWDFAQLGGATFEFTDNTGTYSTDTANPDTFDSGTYGHVDMQALMGTGNYDDFATALQTALDALTARTVTVTWSDSGIAYSDGTTGPGYTIAINAGTIVFTSNTSTLARRILGFATLPSAGASITSNSKPWYVINPSVAARSNVTDDYEGGTIAWDGEAMDGNSYGISRTAVPLYHDWTQAMESKAASFKNSATTVVPWTYQHLFEHCRNVEPIYVKDSLGGTGTDDMVVKLRADGALWKPQRVTADYEGLWNIPFLSRVVQTSAGVSRA